MSDSDIEPSKTTNVAGQTDISTRSILRRLESTESVLTLTDSVIGWRLGQGRLRRHPSPPKPRPSRTRLSAAVHFLNQECLPTGRQFTTESQQDVFCDAWKALKSDSVVGREAESPAPFPTPWRFRRLRRGAFGASEFRR